MNYILTTILVIVNACGQTPIDFKHLTNNWSQGKIEANGKVVKADISRSGWYNLSVNSDSTVVFGDPNNCGIGHERHGKWSINKKDSTVIFFFTKQIGYVNSPGTTDINETEVYKIQKLTAGELVLKKTGQEKILPYVLIEKTKE